MLFVLVAYIGVHVLTVYMSRCLIRSRNYVPLASNWVNPPVFMVSLSSYYVPLRSVFRVMFANNGVQHILCSVFCFAFCSCCVPYLASFSGLSVFVVRYSLTFMITFSIFHDIHFYIEFNYFVLSKKNKNKKIKIISTR